MSRRAAAGIGLGLVSAAVLANLAAAPDPGGPLAESVPANRVTFPVEPGTSFTYGGLQLRNHGSRPAILEAVHLSGASPGLRVEAAYVLRVADTGGELWFSYQRFPPPGLPVAHLHDLAGYEIAAAGSGPDGAVQVVLVLSVAAAGAHRFEALAIDYVVAGRRFRADYPFAMRACAPEVPC